MRRFAQGSAPVRSACEARSRGRRTPHAHPAHAASASKVSPALRLLRAAPSPRHARATQWRCAAAEADGDVVVEALPLEGEGDVNDAHAALGLAKQQLFRALAPLDRGTAASETDVRDRLPPHHPLQHLRTKP
jgi:hypothetical protein